MVSNEVGNKYMNVKDILENLGFEIETYYDTNKTSVLYIDQFLCFRVQWYDIPKHVENGIIQWMEIEEIEDSKFADSSFITIPIQNIETLYNIINSIKKDKTYDRS